MLCTIMYLYRRTKNITSKFIPFNKGGVTHFKCNGFHAWKWGRRFAREGLHIALSCMIFSTQVRKYTSTQIFKYTSTQVICFLALQNYTSTQVQKYTSTEVQKYKSSEKYTSTPVRKYASIQVLKYTSTHESSFAFLSI